MLEIHLMASGVEVSALILVMLGFVVGLVSGLLGLGGGWLVVPALNIMGIPAIYCVGTGLTQMVGTSLVSAWKHRRQGHLDLQLGLALGTPVVIGVIFGKIAMDHIQQAAVADQVIRYLYIGLLSSLGIYMFYESLGTQKNSATSALQPRWFRNLPAWGPVLICQDGPQVPLYFTVVCGLVAGVFSGILGVGGGFLLLPIMIYVIGIETVSAVATSIVCVLAGSMLGSGLYAYEGYVDYVAAGVILIGSVGGSLIGASATKYVIGRHLRMIFAVLVMFTAVSVLCKEFGWDIASQAIIVMGSFLLVTATAFSLWNGMTNLK
jgi:uncharacterized protein